MLIQFASYRSTGKFTTNYRVLGDDVTIGSTPIAKSYLELCDYFGIPIKLVKSYPNKDGLVNFANQTYYHGINISPASLKEEVAVKSVYA
jgi:hypothetical protein